MHSVVFSVTVLMPAFYLVIFGLRSLLESLRSGRSFWEEHRLLWRDEWELILLAMALIPATSGLVAYCAWCSTSDYLVVSSTLLPAAIAAACAVTKRMHVRKTTRRNLLRQILDERKFGSSL